MSEVSSERSGKENGQATPQTASAERQGTAPNVEKGKGKGRKRTWLEKHVPTRHALKEWVEIGGWLSIIIEGIVVVYKLLTGHLTG